MKRKLQNDSDETGNWKNRIARRFIYTVFQ